MKYLTSEWVIRSELSISPRKKTKVNYVDNSVIEDVGEFVDDEIGTVWT